MNIEIKSGAELDELGELYGLVGEPCFDYGLRTRSVTGRDDTKPVAEQGSAYADEHGNPLHPDPVLRWLQRYAAAAPCPASAPATPRTGRESSDEAKRVLGPATAQQSAIAIRPSGLGEAVCARCHDPFPLDPSNEPTVEFGGERYHAQCATVVWQMAEQAVAEANTELRRRRDPYAAHRERLARAPHIGYDLAGTGESDRMVGVDTSLRPEARVKAAFTADVVPERASVVHPWSAEDAEYEL